MHPDLKTLAEALNEPGVEDRLRFEFAQACVEEVATHLEDEAAIDAWRAFKSCMAAFGSQTRTELAELAARLADIANQHPGSHSIDGTRHAAVSATYALFKAVQGKATDAAAYAAYSQIYGYGGYAVHDPGLFAEVHQKQMQIWLHLRARPHLPSAS